MTRTRLNLLPPPLDCEGHLDRGSGPDVCPPGGEVSHELGEVCFGDGQVPLLNSVEGKNGPASLSCGSLCQANHLRARHPLNRP